MKSTLLFLPITLVLALLIAQQTLATLGITANPTYLILGIALSWLFLHQRKMTELVALAILLGVARLGEDHLAAANLTTDAVVALIFTVLLLPTGLRLAGVNGLHSRHAS